MTKTTECSPIIGLGLVLALGCSRSPDPPPDPQFSPLDGPCPPIVASGWLNGPPPTQAEQAGRLVVIDCWGHWCAPCRNSAPRLVKLHDEFEPQGVLFVGLTADGLEALNEIKAHLAHLKIPWPSGYGASETMKSLGVNSLPHRLLVGRDRRIIWRGEDVGPLRQALLRALKPPSRGTGDPP